MPLVCSYGFAGRMKKSSQKYSGMETLFREMGKIAGYFSLWNLVAIASFSFVTPQSPSSW